MTALGPKEQRGLVRVGNALIVPGNGFPAFSDTGAVHRAPEFLGYLPEADRRGLLALLRVLALLPGWAVRLLLAAADRLNWLPGPLGAPFRLVALGLKGLVYTLYYDDPAIHGKIGWDARISDRLVAVDEESRNGSKRTKEVE